jgi:hypothetical protein
LTGSPALKLRWPLPHRPDPSPRQWQSTVGRWPLAITALCAGLGLGAGVVTRAATIGGDAAGIGMVELGGPADRRLTDPVTANPSRSMPCLIDVPTHGAIAADCLAGIRNDGSPAFFSRTPDPISDLDIAALPPFDSAALQSSFDGFWLTAGSSAVAQFDDPLKPRETTDDPDPWWAIDLSSVAKGDIYVKVAVPALAVVALLVAGLLLFGLARRRRRAAWARRIKQSAGRQQPPSSSG